MPRWRTRLTKGKTALAAWRPMPSRPLELAVSVGECEGEEGGDGSDDDGDGDEGERGRVAPEEACDAPLGPAAAPELALPPAPAPAASASSESAERGAPGPASVASPPGPAPAPAWARTA